MITRTAFFKIAFGSIASILLAPFSKSQSAPLIGQYGRTGVPTHRDYVWSKYFKKLEEMQQQLQTRITNPMYIVHSERQEDGTNRLVYNPNDEVVKAQQNMLEALIDHDRNLRIDLGIKLRDIDDDEYMIFPTPEMIECAERFETRYTDWKTIAKDMGVPLNG